VIIWGIVIGTFVIGCMIVGNVVCITWAIAEVVVLGVCLSNGMLSVN